MLVKYDSNNSGGKWWLKDKDWKALEEAGWKVRWAKDMDSIFKDSDGRWLGALASSAEKEFPSLEEAISEWESVTGQSAASLGCNCCGPPHSFEGTDEEGNTTYASPDPPLFGDMSYS